MMRPKKLQILGKNYAVQFVNPAPLADDEHQDCGRCLDSEQRILVQYDLPPELERDTVLHETIHAIDYVLQLELTERQVSVLASGLLAVLKANPSLAPYLVGKK